MKILAIFLTMVVMTSCHPKIPKLRRTQSSGPVVKTWTIKELFNALDSNKNPELQPSIEEGAHQFMLALFLNINWKNVLAAVMSPSGKDTWNNKELTEFMDIASDADDEYQSAISHAHNLLNELEGDNPGADIKDIPVAIGAVDISTWTTNQLEDAIADPKTRIELLPYLEQALKEIKLKNDTQSTATIVTPVGLITNNPELLEFTIPPTLVPYLKKKLDNESEIVTTEAATVPPTEQPIKESVRSRSNIDIPRGVSPQIFVLPGQKKINSTVKTFLG